jgi:hypothetical protein
MIFKSVAQQLFEAGRVSWQGKDIKRHAIGLNNAKWQSFGRSGIHGNILRWKEFRGQGPAQAFAYRTATACFSSYAGAPSQ